MEPFYKYALMISVVFLIICLIGIGILMQYQNAGTKFPLHPNVCPDLFIISTDNLRCVKRSQTDVSFSTLSMGSSICEKQKWAKDSTRNYNWDGVSNYNGCS